MDLNHFQLEQEPFLQDQRVDAFFPGGGREETLQHILNDLENGMDLVHLCGEEGSGKTLICQLIGERHSSTHAIVLVSPSVKSFKVEGRVFAVTVRESGTKHYEEDKLYEVILCLIVDAPHNNESILFIIDDTEKLTASVLTQILNLSYDASPHKKIQFVLAGRLPLGVNPEQYSAILAESLQQVTYTLQPLNVDNTARFLALRLASVGLSDDKLDHIFSTEVIHLIQGITCGNIQLINSLAREAMCNASSAKSPTVLSEHVKFVSKLTGVSHRGVLGQLKLSNNSVKTIISVFAIITLMVVWFSRGSFMASKNDYNVEKSLSSLQEESSEKSHAQTLLPELTEVDALVSELPEVQVLIPGLSEVVQEDVGTLSEKEIDEIFSKSEIVVLTAGNSKIRPEESKGLKRQNFTDNQTEQEMYNKRVAAGEVWIAGKSDRLYTLQLMALKAKTAETNIKQMLSQIRYRQHAENFYILRKKTTPEMVFVYYGEYKNMKAARLAQQELAVSLKEHQPYAISVKEALSKLKK